MDVVKLLFTILPVKRKQNKYSLQTSADLGNKLIKLNRCKIPFILLVLRSVLFSSLMVKNCKCFLSLEKLPNEHLALPTIFVIFRYFNIVFPYVLSLTHACIARVCLIGRVSVVVGLFALLSKSILVKRVSAFKWAFRQDKIKEIVRNIAACVLSGSFNSTLTDN